jgi:hypothetical protein
MMSNNRSQKSGAGGQKEASPTHASFMILDDWLALFFRLLNSGS